MTQRKIVFSLAGLFVTILPGTSAAATAAAGAGASTSTTTTMTGATPAAAGVSPVAPTPTPTPGPPPATTPEQTVTAPAAAKHIRGGGYFRLALGSGFMFGSRKLDDGTTLGKKGLTFSSDLSIGGSVGSGVAIGAGIYGNVPAAETETGGPSFIFLACPFVDAYVDPTKGFHLVGGPCYANARWENNGVSVHGWGVNLGIGYEWSALWGSSLGKGWGLGILARVQYTNFAAKNEIDPFTAIMPGLLISATWY